jgi:hypothetical protein
MKAMEIQWKIVEANLCKTYIISVPLKSSEERATFTLQQ